MKILDQSIQYIKGVGPKRAALLKRLNINTLEDMIWHIPRDYEDRRKLTKIANLKEGERVSFYGQILGEGTILRPRKNLALVKFNIKDDSGVIEVVFFNQLYLKKVLKPGQKLIVNGEVKRGYRGLQLVNPLIDKIGSVREDRQVILPIYPSTEGLSQRELISIQKKAIGEVARALKEYLPDRIVKANRLCSINFAIKNIHFPSSIDALKIAKFRLVFEEFFLLQLGLFKIKKGFIERKKAPALKNNTRIDKLLKSLPYRLTQAQARVFREIQADMERDLPMNRLLQGDVGSGKTILAIMALLKAVDSGYQAAFMAPTEILAEQHYASLIKLLAPFNIKIGLLVGGLLKKDKDKILEQVGAGEINIVIGTHALIQEGVNFHKLALVITDEQHRFGVRQRIKLASKGKNPHVLVMTATPIPRSLALILYGDLDISILDQLPPGRKAVKTYMSASSKRANIYGFVKDQLSRGRQAYVVCPLIEESDSLQVQSATELADDLSNNFLKGYRVGLLHGRMPAREKETIMENFKSAKIDVLVSTTVIEVGINIPNATVMVVENAERFGLAQLHQLRGRVGRSHYQSYCVLINDSQSEIAKERMDIMEKTSDGFIISEKDLELRGPGEFFGTRQHGLPELKVANLFRHISVLKIAQKQVEKIMEEDPDLSLKAYPLLRERLNKKFFL